MSDYAGNSRQPFWHMSMIRDPVDRVLATFLSLKARLAEEASLKTDEAVLDNGEPSGVGVGNYWSRTLNSWCGDTSYVQ
ncbi:unnamed protein product, partial [Ectocarpus fasciculatus]